MNNYQGWLKLNPSVTFLFLTFFNLFIPIVITEKILKLNSQNTYLNQIFA